MPSTGAATISKDDLRKIREKTLLGQKNDAVVLNQYELNKIKQRSTIQTKDQESQQKKLLED
jgi:hypothetical protein